MTSLPFLLFAFTHHPAEHVPPGSGANRSKPLLGFAGSSILSCSDCFTSTAHAGPRKGKDRQRAEEALPWAGPAPTPHARNFQAIRCWGSALKAELGEAISHAGASVRTAAVFLGGRGEDSGAVRPGVA